MMKNNLWVIVASAIYLLISLTNPIGPSSANFNISPIQIRLLQLTIALIMILAWFAGSLSYRELLKYAKNMKDRYQKSAFKNIAKGTILLVLSSIIPAIFSTIGNRFENSVSWVEPTVTIINNYLYVLLPFTAVNLILIGTKSLARSVNAPELTLTKTLITMIFPLSFSILNVYLTLTNPTLQGMTHEVRTTYHLPSYLVIITILAPSIVTWFIGTQALNHVQNYINNVKGEVYKTAISLFGTGFLFVIVSSVFLQLLLALGQERLLGLGLNLIILVVYLFIILQAIGYILLAKSSQKFAQVDKILSQYLAK